MPRTPSVEVDPAAAGAMAERALRLARARHEPEAQVAALHALGFARHELGDVRAVRTLRAAIRVGERHGLARRTALVRRALAVYLAYRGRIGAALRELDAACSVLDAHELAQSEVFRIAVMHLAGQAPTSLAASHQALETLRQAADVIWETRLLKNQGFLLAERGDTEAAEPDLIRARDLYAGRGATQAALGAEYELARIDLAGGDLPACLARLDAIDAADVSALHNSALELLRAKALIAARLMSEARHALRLAQGIWQLAGIGDPEGRLEVVRLTLLAGDPLGAYELARQAQRSFAGQRRPAYAARAVGLSLAAAIAAGTLQPSALRAGRRAAATPAGTGWREEALRVRLLVARGAAELGSTRLARRGLDACASLRRRGAVADRIEAWHVEALLRLAGDDRSGAQRAADTGLRLLETHRAALDASDLRAAISELGIELAQLGLGIALAGGDLSRLLSWAERLRASALRLPAVTPPATSALRERVAELRHVTAEVRQTEAAGRSAQALIARQAALEASIRGLSRHATGRAVASTPAPTRADLGRALGDGALVEYIELDGRLSALALISGRLTRHELGLVAAIEAELDWLRFGVTRLARGGHSQVQRATLRAGVHASASALDQALIAPLGDTLGDRRLVVVPTGSLHALPWAMLPGLSGRSTVVAPSALSWLARAPASRRRRGKTVLVAGPRLRHAAGEIAGIGVSYPQAETLTGRRATVAAVMQALDGAAVAHLACHGRFRSDSPLFSSLELADGPLSVYELQRLRRAPELIVLSSCDLASSDTRPGDELLGFASALIGMGARTGIASAVPVPDVAAKRLMVAMHAHLTAGEEPALALAHAQASAGARRSALASFVCLGAG